MQPSDGQTVQDLVKHADQGVIWSTIGWVIGGLATLVAALLGWDRTSINRKISSLFEWKDKTVDPFISKVPTVYATKEDIRTYVFEPNREDHREIKERLEGMDETLQEMRGMLVERAKK